MPNNEQDRRTFLDHFGAKFEQIFTVEVTTSLFEVILGLQSLTLTPIVNDYAQNPGIDGEEEQ